MGAANRTILGIDPGLANTGWGIVQQNGSRLECVAYGCVSTPDHASDALAAAICYTTHEGYGGAGGADALAKLEERGRVMAGAGTGGAAGAAARKILEEGAR